METEKFDLFLIQRVLPVVIRSISIVVKSSKDFGKTFFIRFVDRILKPLGKTNVLIERDEIVVLVFVTFTFAIVFLYIRERKKLEAAIRKSITSSLLL